MQRHTGATVAASASTAAALRRGENTIDDPQFGFGQGVQRISAGESVRGGQRSAGAAVGKLAITAHMIPGHSPGSAAYTWRSCEGDTCLNMVYADSLTSPSAPGFKYGKRLEEFRRSIEKVAALAVRHRLVAASVFHPGRSETEASCRDEWQGSGPVHRLKRLQRLRSRRPEKTRSPDRRRGREMIVLAKLPVGRCGDDHGCVF